MKRYRVLLIIIFILSIAFGLRIQSLLDGTFAYTYDVGRDLLVLSEISETLKPPLIGPTSGLHGLFYGPWWYYITYVPFTLSGGDPRGVLLFMILTGIGTSLLGYFIGKKIDGVVLGIFILALVGVSPVLTGTSKQIWNPNIAPLIASGIYFILSIIFVRFFESKKQNKLHSGILFFLLGLLLTLTIDAEVIYGSIFFIFTIIYVLFSFRKKLHASYVISFIGGVIFILLPRILFELRHDFLMTRTVFTFLTGGSDDSFSLSFFGNIADRMAILFDLWVRTLALNNELLGYFLLAFVISGILLFYKQATSKEKFFIGYSCTLLLGYLITLSLFQQSIWEHYIVGVPFIYITLFCLIANLFRKNTFNKTLICGIVILILLNAYHVYSHFPKSSDVSDAAYYKNHVGVVDYIYHHANGEQFNTITYTPPVHDYTYRYLFKWYGQKKYGYRPSPINVSRFYVIVEPDGQLPERRQRWLDERSVDGVVLSEATLPGNTLVQVREH